MSTIKQQKARRANGSKSNYTIYDPRGGVRTTLSFEAPKDSHQVREIVGEAGQNRMAASTTRVEMR